MKHIKSIVAKIKTVLKDDSAQGATEYILILVIVVGLAVVAGPKIKSMVNQKLGDVETGMGQVKVD